MFQKLTVFFAAMCWSLPALADVAPGCDCSTVSGAPTLAGVLIAGAALAYTMKRR
jgi:MYXO-CTERM domain-containing protein